MNKTNIYILKEYDFEITVDDIVYYQNSSNTEVQIKVGEVLCDSSQLDIYYKFQFTDKEDKYTSYVIWSLKNQLETKQFEIRNRTLDTFEDVESIAELNEYIKNIYMNKEKQLVGILQHISEFPS